MRFIDLAGAAVLMVLMPMAAFASPAPAPALPACADAAAHLLDFSVGTWKVTTSDGTIDGHNRIERALDGCAVIENWEGTTAGDIGKSLFTYDARDHRWSQIWIRPDTSSKGELVHYELVTTYPDNSVRFLGTRFNGKGQALLQRTTLTPLKDGTFRQFIEASHDGGNVWTTSYDAIYSHERDKDYVIAKPPKDDPAPCRAEPRGHALDFWVGSWKVVDAKNGSLQGTDKVDSALDGCLVIENWHGADADDDGKSFFAFDAKSHQWDQIWVTQDTSRPGGLKYKRLVATFADGGTRFQGDLDLPDGLILLDRTTLTPMPDGRVHQLIEISKDGGTTWMTNFDAIYVKT
jgi:hypothetical protein